VSLTLRGAHPAPLDICKKVGPGEEAATSPPLVAVANFGSAAARRARYPSITVLRGKQGVLAPDVELVRVL
jgi:hypothetical protein